MLDDCSIGVHAQLSTTGKKRGGGEKLTEAFIFERFLYLSYSSVPILIHLKQLLAGTDRT